MNKVHTPEVKSHTSPSAAVYVIPSVGSSMPGMCGSPAEAGRGGVAQNIAPTSATTSSNLFTGQSPLVEVVELGGHAPARTAHNNAQSDPALALFCQLANRNDFDSLTQLCREHLLTAQDAETWLRWMKDRSIVFALRRDYIAAFDVLAEARYQASQTTGTTRAKYEHECGIMRARTGRSSLALDHFGLAYQLFRSAGEVVHCARVDTARASALVTRGETHKALRYLHRAERVATKFADYRLLADVSETKAEAFGVLAKEGER